MFKKKKVKYRSEEDVKKALGIETFRNLSKDKVIEFMSLAPQMDKEVMLSSINQFPQYANLMGDIVKQVKGLSETALKENTTSQMKILDTYIKIIDSFAEEIRSNKISRKRKKELRLEMQILADKAAAKDSENKNFIKTTFKSVTTLAGLVVIVAASLAGLKISSKA